MLVKSKIFSRTYFSPTYRKSFTNIHLNFCSKCSPTYRKFFTNILHQHTFNFLFKFFTNIQFFSPTYRKLFANILHQHTYKFLSSPTYSFTNIQKILHQHISPPSLQPFKIVPMCSSTRMCVCLVIKFWKYNEGNESEIV